MHTSYTLKLIQIVGYVYKIQDILFTIHELELNKDLHTLSIWSFTLLVNDGCKIDNILIENRDLFITDLHSYKSIAIL